MDLIEEFKSYLTTEKKSSANTVSSYVRDLTQFHRYLQGGDFRWPKRTQM